MVRWESKWGGSHPRMCRMPPRLGCPASAPHSTGGWARGQADSVTPAARPAWSKARRLTPLVFWGCWSLIETLPCNSPTCCRADHEPIPNARVQRGVGHVHEQGHEYKQRDKQHRHIWGRGEQRESRHPPSAREDLRSYLRMLRKAYRLF